MKIKTHAWPFAILLLAIPVNIAWIVFLGRAPVALLWSVVRKLLV